MADQPADIVLTLTADIVTAHVGNNAVAVADLPALIAAVHRALSGLGAPAQPVAGPVATPAVSRRASVRPDYVMCLEDGRTFKTLKRHLAADHGMTPADYRAKWQLPADYPLVAPNYAEARRTIARAGRLGRKRAEPAAAVPAAKPVAAPDAKPAAASVAKSVAAKAAEPAAAAKPKRARLRIAGPKQ